MTDLRFETEIDAPAETVFATIVDLRGYSRWLERSRDYPGTTEISAEPMGAGTTYIESGRQGMRHGTVTEFQPPAAVTFHQPMTVRPTLLGKLLGPIDIRVRYTLDPAPASVRVTRVVTYSARWPAVVRLFAEPRFRAESERTMRALKAFAESPS